jgi:hypothetical protein
MRLNKNHEHEHQVHHRLFLCAFWLKHKTDKNEKHYADNNETYSERSCLKMKTAQQQLMRVVVVDEMTLTRSTKE